MDDELGQWEPIGLDAATQVFGVCPFRWWVTGGHSLELHLGRSWRAHADTDISFCRSDSNAVWAALQPWDMHVAAAGTLRPWSGSLLKAEQYEDNVWCRQTPTHPWSLDLTVSDGDDDMWIFRRDPSLRVPWQRAILTSTSGIPYLAPELQLLFKSRAPRAKDDMDARIVLAQLEAPRVEVLRRHLPGDHPWRAMFDGTRTA